MTTDWGIARWMIGVNPYLQTVFDKGAELRYMLTPRDSEWLDYLLDRWLWYPEGKMSKKQSKGLPHFRPLLKKYPPEHLQSLADFLGHLTGKEPDRLLQAGFPQNVDVNTVAWPAAPNRLVYTTTVYQYQRMSDAPDKPLSGPSSSLPSHSDLLRAEMMLAPCNILMAAEAILNGGMERWEQQCADDVGYLFSPERPAKAVDEGRKENKPATEDTSG